MPVSTGHPRDTGDPRDAQTTDTVLMVRPAHFHANLETALSNAFQRTNAADANPDAARAAQREFAALAAALSRAGVHVIEFSGQEAVALPDEVFPNNWLSLHADGTAVLYPLLAENRRRERRRDILAKLQSTYGRRIERVVDLTPLERHGQYLEGTGSLVLDRTLRTAYACLSPRTHTAALAEFGRLLGYDCVPFRAVDRGGRPIYHTNVLLALGTRFAVLCARALPAADERARLRERLAQSGREIVEIGFDELEAFAGNVLELRGAHGPVIALSATALAALGPAERRTLERHGELVAADVATIERLGGGSVRCMLAEVALPRST